MQAYFLRNLSELAHRRAIMVREDGFIDWAWSSERLLKSGVFYRARQETIEMPAQSLAVRQDMMIDNLKGVMHPKGVWSAKEEVREMTIFADYHEMTISLLLYPKDPPFMTNEEDDRGDGLEDTYQRFIRNGQKPY